MKDMKRKFLTVILLAALGMVSVSLVAVVSPATAGVLDTPWSGSGTGTTTVVSDGSVPPAVFHYDQTADPCCGDSGAWNFDTVASTTRTVVLKYRYTGFHSYYLVTVDLNARVGATIYPLVSDGPAICCTPPSAGFQYKGYVVLPVVAGDVYGFDMAGSHYDATGVLRGTLVVDELNKDDCKKDGWQTYLDNNGDPLFMNQGDCVSFVETNGKNDPGQNQPNN